MKKIPTIFKRTYENHKIKDTLPEVVNNLYDVLEKGIATIKWDGSCCAIINGKFYKRYDAKNNKPIPKNAIKCQENPDPITGHMPCWVPVDKDSPSDKWCIEAYEFSKENIEEEYLIDKNTLKDGTYEAVGKHFNGNPYKYDCDMLIPHGIDVISVGRTYGEIREFLKTNNIEGIVFWYNNEPKAKIKRTDFGFKWNSK